VRFAAHAPRASRGVRIASRPSAVAGDGADRREAVRDDARDDARSG